MYCSLAISDGYGAVLIFGAVLFGILGLSVMIAMFNARRSDEYDETGRRDRIRRLSRVFLWLLFCFVVLAALVSWLE